MSTSVKWVLSQLVPLPIGAGRVNEIIDKEYLAECPLCTKASNNGGSIITFISIKLPKPARTSHQCGPVSLAGPAGKESASTTRVWETRCRPDSLALGAPVCDTLYLLFMFTFTWDCVSFN